MCAKFSHYAAALKPGVRKRIIESMDEAMLRASLVRLWEDALPDASVYLTHGQGERGKDLTIVRPQPYGEDVFGLVVKTGKLTATANGQIDTIISQAGMAFDIAAKIPDRLDEPSVTAVWIIVSGTASTGARERIEKQLPSFRPRFIDASELDELFVEHYPEIYFHGELLDYVDSTAATLESDHLTITTAAERLSDVFVDPYLLETELDLTGDEHEVERFLNQRRLRFDRLAATLIRHNRVLVIGEPGVGKSASLRKLAIDGLHKAAALATSRADGAASLPIPLLVPARRFINCAGSDELCSSVLPERVPEGHFTVNVILVDALDEVPAQDHQTVIENATRCAEELGSALVVTSRNVDSVERPPQGFKRFEMLPFEFSQALQLFGKLVKNPDSLGELTEALEQVQNNLALTPLSLVLLVQLAESAEEVPATIGELYDRFTDEVLGKSDYAKGLEAAFDYQIRKRFLAALAFDEFFTKRRFEIPQAEFDAYLEQHFALYGYAAEKRDEFILGLERSEILKIADGVSFKHRSFLDYFAALQVHQEPEKVQDVVTWAVDTYFDDEWSDVAFYYFGHRRLVPREALTRLIERAEGNESDMALHLRKFMLGRLLQAGWHTPVPLRIEGMKGALSYVGAVRSDVRTIAEGLHGPVPEIALDIAVLSLAERSFRSSVLEGSARQILDEVPGVDAPDDEWLAYVALLRALRRHLGEDALLEYSARLEAAVLETGSPALQSRMLLLTGWALEDHPAAKKSLERKFREIASKYREAVKGVLPEPKKGWRPKKPKKA